MTRIKELLNDKDTEKFDTLVYGDDYDFNDCGLMGLLPAGLTFDDEAIECIVILILLEKVYDLKHIDKRKIYQLYVDELNYLVEKNGESFLGEAYFMEGGFNEFTDKFFPDLGCKKASE
jgi:hypothetical protein